MRRAALLLLAIAIPACAPAARLAPSGDDGSGHAAPTGTTARANAAVLAELPFEDERDFDFARRGFVGAIEPPVILDAEGREVWNLERFAFLEGPPPDSVNPSLWRQARLNNIHGLFQVADGVYQVRGYDLANMTLVEGETGWVVIDPLTTLETGRAALALVAEHLGPRPVTGLVYTHSHIDHFGGSRAAIPDPAAAPDVPVIAPEGFLEEAVSENVLAGNTMSRRASYMFGFLLPRGPRGHVDAGLGKASTPGTFGLVAPTHIVDETGSELSVDGVRLVFQNTPGAEAPADMNVYLPDHRVLCAADNVVRALHNLYTLRGAKVRDALLWSGYLDEALRLFPDTEVLTASHNWPTFGREAVADHLKKQRDVYKFIHDQTLRLANHGRTPREIADELRLPASLAQHFGNRDYYGTVRHNAKAVYQHYFGWFDGNPANLDPLPPEEAGPRYVEFMGGADALLAKARTAYEAGDYRFVAMVLSHLVFADPGHDAARALLADTYDQLGYRAESGPWRDFYLTGALELRAGPQTMPFDSVDSPDIVAAIPSALFFDALAVRLDAAKAEGKHVLLNFQFGDIGENHVVEVENAVLHHWQAPPHPDADATLKLDRSTWDALLMGHTTLTAALLDGRVDIDGSRLALVGFFGWLDRFDPSFGIVTP